MQNPVSSLKKIHPALAYAAAHSDEDVSLRVLAGRAGLSPYHLQRIFSAVTGESPKQLTTRLRLSRAAAMLLTGRDSILDIALACGFQSHEVFCRTFRRHFGLTPAAYRARGFAAKTDASQASGHPILVERIGPCVGLYHITEEPLENSMTYSIAKQDLNPQPVLIVRRRVKQSDIGAAITEALPHIFMHAQKNALALAGFPFTRYSEVGRGMMTIEPGMKVVLSENSSWPSVSEPGEVVADTLPGGPAAVTLHAGPYDKLPEAYAALEQWIDAQGLKSAGPPWECYVNDPGDYPNPEDWKTEVYWPVKE